MSRTSREPVPDLTGVLRVVPPGERPTDHVNRGDIALCADLHLAAGAARELIDRGPGAVVSLAEVLGDHDLGVAPLMIVQSGIPLLEATGQPRGGASGKRVHVYGDRIVAGETEVLSVRRVDAEDIRRSLAHSREGTERLLDAFTSAAAARVKAEADTVFHGMNVPALQLPIAGRPVVVAGPGSTPDLRGLRRFLREQRPFLMGVGAGADEMLGLGMQPDIVVTDDGGLLGGNERARLSERVLKHARVVVLREDGTEAAAGAGRLVGLRTMSFPTTLSPFDAALLVAHAHAPSAVIVAGPGHRLEDGLDPDRVDGYLTALRLGDSLTSARVVAQIYTGRVQPWQLALLVLAALLALALAIGTTPIGNDFFHDLF